MPGYINTEELKMFGTNLPVCKEVGKKIIKDIGITIFHFIQWSGCLIFTLILLTSNILVHAMEGLTDLIFVQWDKYMEYVDRKRIIKERTKNNDGEDVEIVISRTSEIKISVVIDQKNLDNAVKALHNEFKLERK